VQHCFVHRFGVKYPCWQKTMDKEIESLQNNNT